ncbi:MAG TPA: glycoside hydrolase family 43 protein, partial [Pyrinomonadaceae bacterium]|nr:glycoside hydrolase family 43 protein [Pyrinomonadaceae bacterium]
MTTTPARAGYRNPVYEHDFPDPYVLKFQGEYWAYCTGLRRDGRAFGILHSRDLVHWRELASALAPLPGAHPCYWAPEVVYRNGRCLMYYSVGNEKLMHIRVATAAHPSGPFVDSGQQLTQAEFAIDPHVFVAADGTPWLFYATDFLTYTHIGTGTVCDRLLDDFTLAGDPRPVTRARYDWQVYDPQRAEKGGVRWHTVEGPFVLQHKGKLYQMFSGGNWQNVSYGVSYAVSDSLARADEWEQVADGQRVLPILRTIPGEVIGPGHNSVVRGPDNQQLFCVYHCWREGEGRVLAIDRLDWIGERMTVLGPSTTPQPAPLAPAFADSFDQAQPADLGAGWTTDGGRWSVRDGAARQEAATAAAARAVCRTRAESFIAEVSLCALAGNQHEDGACGVRLENEAQPVCEFTFTAHGGVLCWPGVGAGEVAASFKLPADFDPSVFHLLRVEVDGTYLRVELDEGLARWHGHMPAAPDRIALLTAHTGALFAGFALTSGWEDSFTSHDWRARGWQEVAGGDDWRVVDQELRSAVSADAPQVLSKGALLQEYELVVNLRLNQEATDGGSCGFYPASGADGRG